VEEKDVKGFLGAILGPDFDSSSIINTVMGRFDCLNIVRLYYEEFERMCAA
jgi:hypothetical protein